jgi:hypothetical protein
MLKRDVHLCDTVVQALDKEMTRGVLVLIALWQL